MDIRHIFLKIAYKLMNLYWVTTKTVSVGVRVVIEHNGKVLLVKHSYREGYYLPGGGVGRTEEFVHAAIREVFEETNLVVKNPRLINVYRNFIEGKSNCVLIYKVGEIVDPDALKIDGVEIIDSKWADVRDIPEDASYYTRQVLESLR